jgi:ERCC4-related helicase
MSSANTQNKNRQITIVESTTNDIDTPRQYQLDLFQQAKDNDVIVVLPTGTGSCQYQKLINLI